jgi:hypothetical protein
MAHGFSFNQDSLLPNVDTFHIDYHFVESSTSRASMTNVAWEPPVGSSNPVLKQFLMVWDIFI